MNNSKIKNFGYYGYTKEEYDRCQELRDSSNLKNVSIVATTSGAMELIFGTLALLADGYARYAALCLPYGFITMVILFLSRKQFKLINPIFVMYALLFLMFSIGILISVPSKNEKAIYFLVIIALLPVLFMDNAWRMTLCLFAACLTFCVLAFKIKDPAIAKHDMFNVFAFGGLSVITQYFVNKKILTGYIIRVQNDEILSAYKAAQEIMQRQARTDLMTGLYNRSYFAEKMTYFLKQCEKNNDTFYLVMLDLDKFKQINDKLGHQKGDEVIIGVADVIKSHLTTGEFATRLGGDEYMFMLTENSHEESLDNVVESIRKNINSINIAPDWNVSTSVGVTRVNVSTTYMFDNLYRLTDKALYDAKALGGNRIIYSGKE